MDDAAGDGFCLFIRIEGKREMGFVDYRKLEKRYTDGFMKDNVENLVEFDAFHCLLAGSMGRVLAAQKILGNVPTQFLDWVKICDGGLLFDTVLLTTKEHDDELGLDFDTYEELNTDEVKRNFGLPEGYAVVAYRSYGDPICFNVMENDEKVYLWNVEKGEFDDIWNSFTDWITEEIDDAIDLIADGSLEPLGIKIGGDGDE